MADSSFDIVSKVDRMEVDNALNQAKKELSQRFDFKNTGADIDWRGDDVIELVANSEDRVKAALEVFKEKVVKRQLSLKCIDAGEVRLSGKDSKITCKIKQGITQEQAKKINKLIKDEGPKGVKTQVMGEEIRVSAKARDDLQAVIALVKGADLDFATQFVNYR